MEYYSVLNRNDLPNHEKTRKDLKFIITKWKKSIWKGYLLYDSNYIIFWERWNSGDSKKISGCQGWWEGGMSSQRQEGVRAVKLLCMILQWQIHVIKHLTKLKEYATPRGNFNVNCGLLCDMMCHCRFISYHNYQPSGGCW